MLIDLFYYGIYIIIMPRFIGYLRIWRVTLSVLDNNLILF